MLHDLTTAVSPVVPAYYVSGTHALLGIHHVASGTSVRELGVVLCHPAPQEYSQTYWAMHKLAGMLAASGFHVLRFDYAGTGDSSGASDDVSLHGWVGDIAGAMQQLRDISGVRRVALVGIRLGAALALRAVAAGARARDVVLWEPVVSGEAYLSELDAVEMRRLAMLNYPEPDERLDDELMGYPFPATLRAETRAIDLTTEPVGRISRLLVVSTAITPAHEALEGYMRAAGADVTMRAVPDPVLYAGDGHPSDALLSHAIPLAIVSFLHDSAS